MIRVTKKLTDIESETINALWNEEYPLKLRGRFGILLNGITRYNHHLLFSNEKIVAWAVDFDRENETWFSIIVDSKHKGIGYGKQLINSLKSSNDMLCGWVIDHDNDKKSNGDSYISPVPFYLKHDFRILNEERLETEIISAVKIKWDKQCFES